MIMYHELHNRAVVKQQVQVHVFQFKNVILICVLIKKS